MHAHKQLSALLVCWIILVNSPISPQLLRLATTAISAVHVTLAALDANWQSANMLNYDGGNGKHYTFSKKICILAMSCDHVWFLSS